MKSVRELFPRCSESFASLNPQLSGGQPQQNALQPIVARSKAKRGTMNKTETEFSFILEAQKRKGDILRWDFEGITLRFAGVRYTPDFVVFTPSSTEVFACIKFIEVKGAFTGGKFERAVERFRHAKTYWGDEFVFELHQKTRDGWKRLL